LPVVLGNPLHFKRDSGFAHANEYGSFGPDGKPNVRGASGRALHSFANRIDSDMRGS
jgi:hypothetical protein